MRIIRHGLGFFITSLFIIWIFSFGVCFHILGLVLDLMGALILAAPAIPQFKAQLYRIPFGPFRTANRIDEAISEVWDDRVVSFTSVDPEFVDIDDVAHRDEVDYDEITLTPRSTDEEDEDDGDAREKHVTVNLGPSSRTASTDIVWGKQELISVLQKASERRLAVAGALLLVIGFSLQIGAILLPPISSPLSGLFVLC